MTYELRVFDADPPERVERKVRTGNPRKTVELPSELVEKLEYQEAETWVGIECASATQANSVLYKLNILTKEEGHGLNAKVAEPAGTKRVELLELARKERAGGAPTPVTLKVRVTETRIPGRGGGRKSASE